MYTCKFSITVPIILTTEIEMKSSQAILENLL